MSSVVINEEVKHSLQKFLRDNPEAGLIETYLQYVQEKFDLHPVVLAKDKTIYQSAEDAVQKLEEQKKLWNETEIKIFYDSQSVNDQTKKIYICPFSGKVFGDNTNPNPQDAIYDWVAKCPENKERIGGLPVKRFYISEDPEVIKGYASKEKPLEEKTKIVFSSVINGKLFNTKASVIKDFKENYLKDISLIEVQAQNRFQIEENFLGFIQKQVVEDKIRQFVESLAENSEFTSYVEQWLG